jgi:quaternary ammonium compound-resistance protein SugE
MAWTFLILAGLMEIGWAVGLKYASGFTRPGPSAVTFVCLALSLWFLSLALKTIPLGTAYAVWTGIGAVGTVLLGMLVFREPAAAARIACLILIVAGTVGLKLFSSN